MRAARIFFLYFLIAPITIASHLEKLSLCSSCHGQNGIASQKSWPNLAGQSKQYLIKQLHDYQSKRRHSDLMEPYAHLLTEQEIIQLSEYYSQQPQPGSQHPIHPSKLGEQLYKTGDSSRKIPACIACHGPSGQGNDPAKYPNIRHQHAAYLLQELQAFKLKQRHNDPQHMMQDICERLQPQDMHAIIEYLKSLSLSK